MENKKGQVTIGEAPTFILIIGLIFLILATIALVGEKYGDSLSADLSGQHTAESLGTVTNLTVYTLSANTHCNVESCNVLSIYNETGGETILSGNYSVSSDCEVTIDLDYDYVAATDTFIANYTWQYAGVACNVTDDLQKEIGDNTSLAGLVLTIGLVGLVLTILMGVFFLVGRGQRV